MNRSEESLMNKNFQKGEKGKIYKDVSQEDIPGLGEEEGGEEGALCLATLNEHKWTLKNINEQYEHNLKTDTFWVTDTGNYPFQKERSDGCSLSKVIKIRLLKWDGLIQNVLWWTSRLHISYWIFLPKLFNLNVTIRKHSDKFKMWNIVPKKVELFYEKKNKNEENSVGFKREEKRNQKGLMSWCCALFDQVLGLKVNIATEKK